MISFSKPDEVLFNREDLKKAILMKTNKPKNVYKISIRNQYPCLYIGHKHYYVHRLLGELYFGDLTGSVIHHKNGEKTDNSKENLILMTNSEHTTLHHCGNDFRTEDGIRRSVNAMANSKRRNDINPIEVRKMREEGLTYKELCNYFKCGNSVIRKCLAIDWSESE